jgi:hypothetical protein
MRAITVCHGYDDLLAVTLPLSAPHFDEILVVSHPDDIATAEVVAGVRNARLFTTDAFFRGGAEFRKGLAMEEGFDAFGVREPGADGWLCILDADIVLPPAEVMAEHLAEIRPGYLYSPWRRILADPRQWSPQLDWEAVPRKRDMEFAGYFQLFHLRDPVLKKRPWYGTRWRHAGGCDSVFMRHWPDRRLKRLDFEVLHLGPDGTNWCGRATPRLDGSIPAGAEQRAAKLKGYFKVREQTGRNDHEWLDRGQ